MCWTARAFPRLLADCANEVEEADFNGDGETDLRWYYHGGCEGRPLVKYSDQCTRDFEQYPGAYRFDVREAGCSFIRILKGAEK